MRDAAVKARRGGAHRATNVRWWQVVSAVVPVTLVAGAWGIAIGATPGAETVDATSGSEAPKHGAPVVTDVPTNVFERPTARTTKSRQSRSAPLAGFDKASATPASLRSSPLPSAAIDAYHDAAKVMSDVKASCKLDWTLIAAIGRVESNHGQYGGSTVSSSGDTQPKIIGIPLNGTNNTAAIRDTDNGQLDGDTTWDRAVGPMQFIPSTWDLIAVDGNGDGDKDPSNVYDAALGTAVYLCADGEDVSTDAGASAAVYSYNHSNDYVATVLAIAEQYREGNFTEEPSVYLPDTDPEVDVFDPGAGTNDDGEANADNGPRESNDQGNTNKGGNAGPEGSGGTLDRTDFGGPTSGESGEQRVQPLEKKQDSAFVGGGAIIDPAVPDNDPNLLDEQTFETAPGSGKPTNPHGQSGPGTIHGFADNHSTKPKHKSRDDLIKGFSRGGTTSPREGGGVSVRPGRTEAKPKTEKNTTDSAETTKPKNNPAPKNNATPKNNEPRSGAKHKADSAPKANTKKRPKHRKLGAIKNAAEQTELCAKGTDELRDAGTNLSDDQATRLVTTCVDNFAVAASMNSDDPILGWLTVNVDEL